MRVRAEEWGGSLAFRIPASFAAMTGLTEGADVDLTIEAGRLVITPLTNPKQTLDDLLARVTPENRHREVDTGPSAGIEAWP